MVTNSLLTLYFNINNAAAQMTPEPFEDFTEKQFRLTLRTNALGYVYLVNPVSKWLYYLQL